MAQLVFPVPLEPMKRYACDKREETISFFNELGVETKVERGNRVFPVSDKSMTVVDALVSYIKVVLCVLTIQKI